MRLKRFGNFNQGKAGYSRGLQKVLPIRFMERPKTSTIIGKGYGMHDSIEFTVVPSHIFRELLNVNVDCIAIAAINVEEAARLFRSESKQATD